ncbi:uncharacterized protein LOC123016304 [Tribolium madens]|uniref:uncharacterized protein LOC123016304 n=1 Tax=Tribolium madens TaxID=41895 RepID=UPI001CF72E14|nr:uncharacterized protein LOC123016304 [Tribolium madens]
MEATAENENAERCVVPNCKNTATTGIPFPKQTELLKQWLEALEIPDFVPTDTSFVCLDHFSDDSDVLDRVKENALENVLEELPIPSPTKFKEAEKNPPKPSTSGEKTPSLERPNLDAFGRPRLDHESACRLCLGKEEATTNIYTLLAPNVTIAQAIIACMPSLRVAKGDRLSKLICPPCLQTVRRYHKFRSDCLTSDQKQREAIRFAEKRKIHESQTIQVKKFCADDIRKYTELHPIKKEVKAEKSDIDKKFEYVEAELMKALEGRLTDEMKSADNIIIQVQSDDEEVHEQESSVAIVGPSNVVKVGNSELKLPKGIKVSVNQTRVGTYEAKEIEGVYNSESFCLVDNYVFEYRLCKGNVRHLKCLIGKCRASAEQTTPESGIVDSKVVVKVGHNHPAPSSEERRKQIFLHLMRRKMQSDKSLNFRSVYEEFCEKDPQMRQLVPLKTVINQICCQQMNLKSPPIYSFEQFFDQIENDEFQKLHFTHGHKQFYQERLTASDGGKAVIFANCETIEEISESKIMYVDASYKIDTSENFKYHLITVLVWISDNEKYQPIVVKKRKIKFDCFQYYPIMFALTNEKSPEIYKTVFTYLRDILAPKLKPEEIVTDYEATLHYSLGEIYGDSHIGGSVFYYTQNIYKKICSLNLSRELETNSCFRNIYHMILMLPLLPVNTIIDGLNNIELQASEMGQGELTAPIFDYIKDQWINKVTPDLFCVHRLENRINENVIAPFKKLRDFLMISKGKMQKQQINIVSVVEKLIELEAFLSTVNTAPSKRTFARDLSVSQKKNVVRAWQFIESHPKININHFFNKVLGYIKCMENQLWIWGFYRYTGEANDELINAANFSIVNTEENDDHNYEYVDYEYAENEVVVDVVVDQKHGFLVKDTQEEIQTTDEEFEHSYTEQ